MVTKRGFAMSSSKRRPLFVLAAATLLATGTTGGYASALEPGASGSGSVGSVDVTIDGTPVQQDPIAPCDVDGVPTDESDKVTVGDVATFYGGETTCTRTEDEEAEVTVSGEAFVTDVLRDWGGPRIRLSGYDVSCRTSANGSSGMVELRGIRGIEVPEEIEPNHTITIPGATADAAPIAKVVLNEFVTPEPPDGSMRLNAMRIELYPDGNPAGSGSIVVGSVACDPFGG
jgi:hypothetical protein